MEILDSVPAVVRRSKYADSVDEWSALPDEDRTRGWAVVHTVGTNSAAKKAAARIRADLEKAGRSEVNVEVGQLDEGENAGEFAVLLNESDDDVEEADSPEEVPTKKPKKAKKAKPKKTKKKTKSKKVEEVDEVEEDHDDHLDDDDGLLNDFEDGAYDDFLD